MAELERDAETALKRGVKRLGGECFKFVSPGTSGVPDRIIMLSGHIYLVELKKPDGHPTPLQQLVHRRIRAQGIEVYVVRGKAGVAQFLQFIEAML